MTTVFFKFKRRVRVEFIHRSTVLKIEQQFRSLKQAQAQAQALIPANSHL